MSEHCFAYELTSTLPRCLRDSSTVWSAARHRLYRLAFGSLYRCVLDSLESGQLREGPLNVRVGPSILFAYIKIRGFAVGLNVIAFEVDWCGSDDGWDGDGAGLDNYAYDVKIITTTGRLYLEGGEFRFEQVSGDPIEWPQEEGRPTIIDRGEEISFVRRPSVQLRINVMPRKRIDAGSPTSAFSLTSVVEVTAVRKNPITGQTEVIDAAEFLANLDALSPDIALTFSWRAHTAAQSRRAVDDDRADGLEDERGPEL